MYEIVSADDAINKGERMVKYPVLTMLFAPTVISVLLALGDFIPDRVILIALVSSIILAWLIYCFMASRWRIWAFENVRNVHELKTMAIQEQLWPDSSIFGKLEIHTGAYTEKWQLLQSKFDQADVFQDDLSIPAETIIYYAKFKSYPQLIIILILLAVSVYMPVIDKFIMGGIIGLGVIYLAFREYKQATNKAPQIIINSEGIQTTSTVFYAWKYVRNEKIVLRSVRRNVYTYLQYDYPGGTELLKIDDYATDRRKLHRLLVVYRGRSKGRLNQ